MYPMAGAGTCCRVWLVGSLVQDPEAYELVEVRLLHRMAQRPSWTRRIAAHAPRTRLRRLAGQRSAQSVAQVINTPLL